MPLFYALSRQALALRLDWWVFIVAGWIVWAIVIGLILYCCVRWRNRGQKPEEFTKNTKIELISVIVPLLIVAALFVFNQRQEDVVDALAATPQNRIDVTAYRWSWKFSYVGTPVTVYGTPMQPPTLYLPEGKVTQIALTSTDVTHSFWIPALLFKRDAIPGLINRFDLTPTKLGRYPSRCAQFCGLDHAFMTFTVRVVSPAAYDRYLASRGAQQP